MGKRLTIGLLDENAYNEYHGMIASGVRMSAKKHDINVIRIGHFLTDITTRSEYHEKVLHEYIEQFNFDGLMFLGWGRAFSNDNFRSMFKDIPTVSFGMGVAGIPSIIFLGESYIEEILNHLIQVHKRSKIAFIAPISPDTRVKAYTRTMKQYNLYDPQLYISEKDLIDLSINARGVRAVDILLDERKLKIDAIVSLYNAETYEIIKALNARGIRVPEDIAVTSYEEGEISRFSSPSFTTVNFLWKELGYYGCETLHTLITNGEAPLVTEISGGVIYRNSCGCIPHSAEVADLDLSRQLKKGFLELSQIELEEIAERIAAVTFFTIKEAWLLLDKFRQAIAGSSEKPFLSELEMILRRAFLYEKHDDIGQASVMFRRILIPHFLPYRRNRKELIVRAEDLFVQMQTILQAKRTVAWFSDEIRSNLLKLTLNEVGQIFITNFNVKSLMDSIETNLPRIGVNGCYIYLFDKSDSSSGLFDNYSLEFEYRDGRKVRRRKVRRRKTNSRNEKANFDEVLFRDDRSYFLLSHLLYVGDEFMGFILFDPSYMDLRIYRTLGLQISTALNNIIMFKKLDDGYRKLMDQAHRRGMADSTAVLHDIANIMNSVNVTTQAMENLMGNCPVDDLVMANGLLSEKADELESFVRDDRKGKLLMQFYADLGGEFEKFSEKMQASINRLMDSTRLIEDIINVQQSYTGVRSNLESVELGAIVDDIIRMYSAMIDKAGIKVVKSYETLVPALVQRTKLYHVLTNVIKNAIESMEKTDREKVLTIIINEEDQKICIRICDTGEGISEENLESIFAYGYTTKKDGHGFGLHSCANYMTEMKGRLRAERSESGKGAVFVLELMTREDSC
jgi:signal transduction histidine kinase/DNA-binding LacI/PurR family transcriptional regulator